MENEVRFSKEQMNAIESMLKGDIVPLINTEIKNNYIPRLLVEKILEECKKAERRKQRPCKRHVLSRLYLYL